MTTLAVRDVLVRRGGRSILEVGELEARSGEVLAVIGPNGAGKSTLVQVMALLDRPEHGHISFDGAEVSHGRLAYRRRMAVVFQEPLLLDTTVEGNVRSGLRLRGVRGAEARERAVRWMASFGIAALARRSARTLSGGEAQRTSLSRAFALEPEVLLLDEPFAALDAPTRQALMDDLEAVLATSGAATVFVTHDRSEAIRLGDRVAVLMAGRVRQTGTPAEVFSSPVDEEVAAFVGVENIVSGRVREVRDGLAVVEVGGSTVESGAVSGPGSHVSVCVRPEEIVLARPESAGGPSSARNHVAATVKRIVPSGPYVRVELDAGFGLIALITRPSLEDLALAPGVRVIATFKATSVHLIPHRSQPSG